MKSIGQKTNANEGLKALVKESKIDFLFIEKYGFRNY